MSIDQTKKCSKCSEVKSLSKFHKQKDKPLGVRSNCKRCRKIYAIKHRKEKAVYDKLYYEVNKDEHIKYQTQYKIYNKEKIKQRRQEYYENNKDKIKNKVKSYYQEHNDQIKEYNKTYYLINKEKLKEYNKINRDRIQTNQNNRYKNNFNYKLKRILSERIRGAVKNQLGTKSQKTIDLLGCTIEECRNHLESHFTEGMNWENHGDWHIDHIRPCASFDLTDPEQQKECFHYTNIQPLWAEDNLKKSDKWEY